MRILSFLVLSGCSFLLANCSIRTMAIREVSELVSVGVPAFERDDDPELIREALPANIKLLETLLESDPDNARLLTTLSQMYGSYTFGFVEFELDKPNVPQKVLLRERTNRLYLRGIRYGERALALASKTCAEGLKKATEVDLCFNALGKDDVPAMFWYGFNLAAYINRNLNAVDALAQGVNVEKSMQRVIALDENYTFGCAHVLLMAYYGSRSPMMGGNPGKAKEHYARAQALTKNQFWLADVFYARYVLVQDDDQAGFERLLKSIAEKDKPLNEGSSPRLGLYNSLAKNRAKLYLGTVDEYF